MAKMTTTIDSENLTPVEPGKKELNKLVMNFLLTEGYVETARKFHLESGTEHIDLTTSAARMEIKKAILSGNVEDALNRLDHLNPEILNKNTKLLFYLHQQWFLELIRNDKNEEALKFAQKELGPRILQTSSLLEELEKTTALLAFNNPRECPYYNLLDLSRRRKIANAVNAAILISEKHEKDPKLQSLLKQLLRAHNQLQCSASNSIN